jgi:Reverse transcriptase (RNA-dependent DNA polymerase)
MKIELKTLTDMKCWDVVPRTPSMNVLPSTWAFKLKRYPDGSVRKYKARFCAGGHRQIEGVDFFETFAPVVNWTTVRLLLILSQVLNLSSRQVDYTAAFVHAPIDDEVYVAMPRGFSEPGKVLKLRRSLYGLKQSPRNFFQYLKSNLEKSGFRNPSPDTDPCLFVSDKVICVVYVDDTLLWSPKSEWIDEAVARLERTGMALEVEESVAGFLGVLIERNQADGSIKLTQVGLIKRIISALGIENEPAVHTPSTTVPLTKDLDGDPPDGSFNYASVIGMLGYLQSNSRPDITFAVSSAARFTHFPRRSHEEALKRIGRYLKGTINEGLVLRPSDSLDIDCYVDADFAGLWPHEEKSDPSCVKSRTGFAICVANCPVIWSSKLQGDIATSTMEAEYSALSTAMRDLLPFRELLITLAPSIGINTQHPTVFKTTVHEDNAGALALANLEPGRITPRSKHYAVKMHWFRSKLDPEGTHPITIVKIATDLQRADILTKGLNKLKFQAIRKQLCGW